jgi:hypothetical protein
MSLLSGTEAPRSAKNVITAIKMRRMRWAGNVALMGAIRYEKGFVGKHEEKRTLGRSRRRWEDNVKMYCHVLVTRHGVWIGNWIYWTLITRNYR